MARPIYCLQLERDCRPGREADSRRLRVPLRCSSWRCIIRRSLSDCDSRLTNCLLIHSVCFIAYRTCCKIWCKCVVLLFVCFFWFQVTEYTIGRMLIIKKKKTRFNKNNDHYERNWHVFENETVCCVVYIAESFGLRLNETTKVRENWML